MKQFMKSVLCNLATDQCKLILLSVADICNAEVSIAEVTICRRCVQQKLLCRSRQRVNALNHQPCSWTSSDCNFSCENTSLQMISHLACSNSFVSWFIDKFWQPCSFKVGRDRILKKKNFTRATPKKADDEDNTLKKRTTTEERSGKRCVRMNSLLSSAFAPFSSW